MPECAELDFRNYHTTIVIRKQGDNSIGLLRELDNMTIKYVRISIIL